MTRATCRGEVFRGEVFRGEQVRGPWRPAASRVPRPPRLCRSGFLSPGPARLSSSSAPSGSQRHFLGDLVTLRYGGSGDTGHTAGPENVALGVRGDEGGGEGGGLRLASAEGPGAPCHHPGAPSVAPGCWGQSWDLGLSQAGSRQPLAPEARVWHQWFTLEVTLGSVVGGPGTRDRS